MPVAPGSQVCFLNLMTKMQKVPELAVAGSVGNSKADLEEHSLGSVVSLVLPSGLVDYWPYSEVKSWAIRF